MNKSMQEYVDVSNQKIRAYSEQKKLQLAIVAENLRRTEQNRKLEVDILHLDIPHKHNIIAIKKDEMHEQRRHEIRIIEQVYSKEGLQTINDFKRRKVITNLQAMLRTEPGVQKLEALMNDAEFMELLRELLPEICDQLCEIFKNDGPVNDSVAYSML